MSDSINRSAAIHAVCAFAVLRYDASPEDLDAIGAVLNALPSAQPEIIRCKECKYYLYSSEVCSLIDTRLNFYATDKTWSGDSFCSWAERR